MLYTCLIEYVSRNTHYYGKQLNYLELMILKNKNAISFVSLQQDRLKSLEC